MCRRSGTCACKIWHGHFSFCPCQLLWIIDCKTESHWSTTPFLLVTDTRKRNKHHTYSLFIFKNFSHDWTLQYTLERKPCHCGGFEKTFCKRTKLRSLADHLDWRLARTKAFCPRMINLILPYRGFFRHSLESCDWTFVTICLIFFQVLLKHSN